MRTSRIVWMAAALIAGAALSGCSTPASEELRTDADPITSRFAQLDGLESVVWLGGTEGDDRAPGPSLYWVDAIVTVDAAHLATITDGLDLQPVDAPDLHDPLGAELPDGPFVGSPELDAAFSVDTYRSSVAIDVNDGVVVLVSQFE